MKHTTTADKGELLPLPDAAIKHQGETATFEPIGPVVPYYTSAQMREYALANMNRPTNEGQDGETVGYLLKFADGSEEFSRYLPANPDYSDIPHKVTTLYSKRQTNNGHYGLTKKEIENLFKVWWQSINPEHFKLSPFNRYAYEKQEIWAAAIAMEGFKACAEALVKD